MAFSKDGSVGKQATICEFLDYVATGCISSYYTFGPDRSQAFRPRPLKLVEGSSYQYLLVKDSIIDDHLDVQQ